MRKKINKIATDEFNVLTTDLQSILSNYKLSASLFHSLVLLRAVHTLFNTKSKIFLLLLFCSLSWPLSEINFSNKEQNFYFKHLMPLMSTSVKSSFVTFTVKKRFI